MLGTTFVDGGLSCLSGRAACYRTSILVAADFAREFLHETVVDPATGATQLVVVGDDKKLTAMLFHRGWTIKIQAAPDGLVHTTLGDPARFFAQCLRWCRATVRENLRILADPRIRRRFPWSVYAAFASNLVNFALFWEPFLLLTLWVAAAPTESRWAVMLLLGLWILFFKLVKSLGHFRRHPADLVYVVPLILFTYYHSVLKARAWLTRNSTKWEGRKLATLAAQKATLGAKNS